MEAEPIGVEQRGTGVTRLRVAAISMLVLALVLTACAPPPPNVVLICAETLRADSVSINGHPVELDEADLERLRALGYLD